MGRKRYEALVRVTRELGVGEEFDVATKRLELDNELRRINSNLEPDIIWEIEAGPHYCAEEPHAFTATEVFQLIGALRRYGEVGSRAVTALQQLGVPIDAKQVEAIQALAELARDLDVLQESRAEVERLEKALEEAHDKLVGWTETLESDLASMRSDLPEGRRRRYG